MKDLVDFALTYESIRPEKHRDNRDLGSTLSMALTSPAMSMNIDYINDDIVGVQNMLDSPNVMESI